MRTNVTCRCGCPVSAQSVSGAAKVRCPSCGRLVEAGSRPVPPPLPHLAPSPPPIPGGPLQREVALWFRELKPSIVLAAAAVGMAVIGFVLVLSVMRRTDPFQPAGRALALVDEPAEALPRLVPLPNVKPLEPLEQPEPLKPLKLPDAPVVAEVKAVPADLPPLTTREIVARSEASVALIRGRNGSGTGFIAGPGILVTNSHVIRGELIGSLEVHFPAAADGRKGPYSARLLEENGPRDLAVLRVETDLPPLPFAESYNFRKGEDVTIIGSPGFGDGVLENAVTQGVLSTQTTLEGQRYYQLGAAVNPGNSGGPAFDSLGRVIGVVTSMARKQQAIGFCVPVDDALAMLARVKTHDKSTRAELAAAHDAQAIARSLHSVGTESLAVLQIYLAAIKAAVAAGRPAQSGLEKALEVLAKLPNRPVLIVPRDLSDALKSPELPVRLRGTLSDLRDATVALIELANIPRGSVTEFAQQTVDLQQRFDQSVSRVETALSVKLSDD